MYYLLKHEKTMIHSKHDNFDRKRMTQTEVQDYNTPMQG